MKEISLKPTIRLIALDMDGTLLCSDQTVSDENAKALLYAHEKGAQIAIVSGRAPREITCHTEGLRGVPVHILGLNGAYARMADGNDEITYLPAEFFSKCIRATAKYGFRYFFYTDEGLYTNTPNKGSGVFKLNLVTDDEALRHADRAVKFVASSDDRRLAELRAEVETLDVTISSSWHSNFEVNARGIDKGTALCALAERLNIPQESVMAAGDQENDLSMLRWAGVPVAMGNAIDEVRRAAIYQTAHHNEHGVAKAIYHFMEKD